MPQTVKLETIKKFFEKRNPASHKGENGKALIIGGSNDLVGAPALATSAAKTVLRSGADLCTILAPEKTGFAINALTPDTIVKKVRGKFFEKKHLKIALKLSENADTVLIGNGIGKEKTTMAFCREFTKKCRKPLVIDADAIKACAKMKFPGVSENALITPHEKEFFDFTGIKISGKPLSEKIKIVEKSAEKYKCIILLKGKTDIISNGKQTFLNKTGNPGMTHAGTGDVLAGLCTGYSALGLTLIQAAQTSAFVNGKIGQELFKEKGYGYIASDFPEKIPAWTKKLLK